MKLVDKPAKAPKKDAVSPGEDTGSKAAVRAELIKKPAPRANIENYEHAYETFNWDDAKKEISYFAGGKMNAAYNAVDRHMHDGRRNKVALYSVNASNKIEKTDIPGRLRTIEQNGQRSEKARRQAWRQSLRFSIARA